MPRTTMDSTDKRIGSRLRMCRLAHGMSQEALGKAVDLSFQQVQKYERGVNRMGGSRLQQIADVLGVSPGYFFRDAPPAPDMEATLARDALATLDNFMSTDVGVAIAKAMSGIVSAKLQWSIVRLAEEIVTRDQGGNDASNNDESLPA